MKKLSVVIMLFLLTQSFAQNNHIYGELLGPGLMASINYERNLDNDIFVRAGYGHFSVESTSNSIFSSSKTTITINPLILGIHYIRGLRGNWKLDAGAGISYWMIEVEGDEEGSTTFGDLSFEAKGSYPTAYGSLGIRYQKPERGISVKLGVSPTFIKIGDVSETFGFPHISLGYSFQ